MLQGVFVRGLLYIYITIHKDAVLEFFTSYSLHNKLTTSKLTFQLCNIGIFTRSQTTWWRWILEDSIKPSPRTKITSTNERQMSTLKTTRSSSVPKRLSQILIPATNHPGLEWFNDWSCNWGHASWRFHVRCSQAPPVGRGFAVVVFLEPTPPPPPPPPLPHPLPVSE